MDKSDRWKVQVNARPVGWLWAESCRDVSRRPPRVPRGGCSPPRKRPWRQTAARSKDEERKWDMEGVRACGTSEWRRGWPDGRQGKGPEKKGWGPLVFG